MTRGKCQAESETIRVSGPAREDQDTYMFNKPVCIPFTRNKDLSMDNCLSQLLAKTSRALRREQLLTTLLHPSAQTGALPHCPPRFRS